MSDLVEFLLQRIEEDEAGGLLPSAWWPHERVLAECAARRRIIEWVQDDELEAAPDLAMGHWEGHGSDERWVRDVPHELLRFLAAPFSGHPDFRPEWSAE